MPLNIIFCSHQNTRKRIPYIKIKVTCFANNQHHQSLIKYLLTMAVI